MALLACPFCRALFPRGEAEACPECGVTLRPLHELPPSLEALEEARERGEDETPPDEQLLPWDYLRRGRGALLALSTLGLACFFLPWVSMQRPELVELSGFELAATRAGWLWGGAVGWFVQLPLVWTRRTIARLRGVRVVCAFFSSLTLIEVAALLLFTRAPAGRLPIAFEWGWGLWASALVAALSTVVALRLGGHPQEPPSPDRWRGAPPDASLH